MHALRAGVARRLLDGEDRSMEQLLNVLTWIVALLLLGALLRVARDWWRRRGYRAIDQDDRGMYSAALLGTNDSWERLPVAVEMTTRVSSQRRRDADDQESKA